MRTREDELLDIIELFGQDMSTLGWLLSNEEFNDIVTVPCSWLPLLIFEDLEQLELESNVPPHSVKCSVAGFPN